MVPGYHNAYSKTLSDLSVCEAGRFSESDERRFWAKVEKSAGCWLWTANKVGFGGERRYGQFTITVAPGKQDHIYAHRVSWELSHGPVPEGLWVLHSCDVPHCVNPAHLFLGTHTDNMRDAARKRRLSTPRPSSHKVSTAQLAEIDALLAAGERQARIAERYGVTKAWVSRYVKGGLRQYDRPQAARRTEAA